MNRTRKLAMVVGTVAVAMGLGHALQNGLPGSGDRHADLPPAPQGITPLAAGLGQGPDTTLPPVATPAPTLTPEAMLPSPAPRDGAVGTSDHAAEPAGTGAATPAETRSGGASSAAVTPDATAPLPDPALAALSGDSVNCPAELELLPAEGATLSLALLAPLPQR